MQEDKRKEYLDWDELFMLMPDLVAKRSKDPNTQTGACIVNDDNIIIGLGYNGFPNGCHDDKFPWCREGETLENKYTYVVHAEANAILNANASVRDCRLYVTLFPCNECAKLIIQSGIKEVVYDSDRYAEVDIFKASKEMLTESGIKLRQYSPGYKMTLTKNKQSKNK